MGVSARQKAFVACFCYALPAFDKEANDFTEAAGTAGWYLYDLDKARILEDMSEIVGSIHADRDTPRQCNTEEPTLLELRARVESIKNNYLKRINAPVGVKPTLKCWMELNEGRHTRLITALHWKISAPFLRWWAICAMRWTGRLRAMILKR